MTHIGAWGTGYRNPAQAPDHTGVQAGAAKSGVYATVQEVRTAAAQVGEGAVPGAAEDCRAGTAEKTGEDERGEVGNTEGGGIVRCRPMLQLKQSGLRRVPAVVG